MAQASVYAQYQAPYYRIVKVEAHFANGSIAHGSGVLVGRNDVLTASHVIYNAALGGLASQISVVPGYDQDPTEDGDFAALGPTPFGVYQVETATYNTNFDPDGDGQLLSGDNGSDLVGTERDVALLGLTVPVGDVLGYMTPTVLTGGALSVHVGGYPSGFGDQTDQTGTIIYNPVDYHFQVGHFDLRPGNSGGPLWYGDAATQYVVGLVSTTGYAHDIGALYSTITSSIVQNDSVIGSLQLTGTAGNDRLSNSADAALYDGKDGIDTFVVGAARAAFTVTSGVKLTQTDTGTTDYVYNVERFQFSDGTLAFDIDGNAGQAYRLYKAAFDRTPDAEGLGYWIAELDSGVTDLAHAALNFILSAEFQQLYGAPGSVADESFVTLLYNNVLDRDPDAAGQAYWLAELGRGFARERVLASFSESSENRAATESLVADGIWFT